MKTIFQPALSALLSGLMFLAVGSGHAVAADDEAAKLKELERAMSAPGDGEPAKKKVRTRAIVFDNDKSTSPAAASGPAPAPAAALDCANLPSDAKANAVDFAIQFQVGSAKVSPASEATLGSIAKILALAPDRCVLVEGHTDATGNADKNMALSKERAGSVVNHIAEKSGIDRKRLVPVGKGSTSPVSGLAPSDPKNRRVVFKVVAG
jgi:outer membrane protein OmpA-like peptidoglycan-associated protein